jgi:cyclase
MLRPRLIPCLLVHRSGLVKTVGFDKPKYVGDPLNAVRIFNEKEVDELMVLDIDATREQREPDYTLIRNLAAECRMPLAYGGGVRTVEQFERLVGLGVEKVAISAAAVADPALIGAAAARVGSQSVVVVLDVRRDGPSYRMFTHNGTRATGLDPAAFARGAERLGAGEIVVNSIDRDGQMKGYDLELVRRIREAVSRPLTVLGGAGSLADIGTLLGEFGLIGAGAGSLFVFKGVYRAVLINYPSRADKDKLLAEVGRGRAA